MARVCGSRAPLGRPAPGRLPPCATAGNQINQHSGECARLRRYVCSVTGSEAVTRAGLCATLDDFNARVTPPAVIALAATEHAAVSPSAADA